MPLLPNALFSLSLRSSGLDQPSGTMVLGALGVILAVVVFCVWMTALIVIGIVAAVRRRRLKKQAAEGPQPGRPLS